mgnify:CR=1 FL=1
MKLSQFKFNLPKELIAKFPSENRDESRLLVVHKESGKIEHKVFKVIIWVYFIANIKKFKICTKRYKVMLYIHLVKS